MMFVTRERANQMAKSYERLYGFSMAFPNRVQSSPQYKEFMSAFGKDSIAFLLSEAASRPTSTLLGMLENLTGVNPVPASYKGNTAEAAKYWVKWGLANKGRI